MLHQIVRRIVVSLAAVMVLSGADWAQFRGPNASGIATDVKLPLSWSDEENVEWKVKVPGRSVSSPIVVGNRVIVTSNEPVKQDLLHVLCFDAKSGDELWRRNFWATGRTATHRTSAVAAPTPASDGERIFAFFSSNDLICLDLDGNLVWYRGLALDYPKAGNDIGMASSPAVVNGTVAVQIENQGDSFAAGIDAETGTTLWRLPREQRANWASPVVLAASGDRPAAILLQSPAGLTAVRPRTGQTVWTFETSCSGVPSSVPSGDRLFVPSNGITAFNLSSSAPEIAWDSSRLRPGSGSPIVYRGHVYAISSGVLKCGDADSGKVSWEMRLGGRFWATPIAVGDHLYTVNQDGDAKVVDITGRKGKVVGSAKFGEAVLGTPAIGAGAMFVRSAGHLWKIVAK